MSTEDAFNAGKRARRRGAPAPMPFVWVAVRLLAVVDAVAVQSVLLYWVWTWPGHHGGLVGGVVATLLIWWALRRGYRAAFQFERYRWMARHFLKLLAVGLILQLVFWLQR